MTSLFNGLTSNLKEKYLIKLSDLYNQCIESIDTIKIIENKNEESKTALDEIKKIINNNDELNIGNIDFKNFKKKN